jgi:hypothetical protein
MRQWCFENVPEISLPPCTVSYRKFGINKENDFMHHLDMPWRLTLLVEAFLSSWPVCSPASSPWLPLFLFGIIPKFF